MGGVSTLQADDCTWFAELDVWLPTLSHPYVSGLSFRSVCRKKSRLKTSIYSIDTVSPSHRRRTNPIEAATGVDIIIDDTPEAVVISCHNPIRREIARVALEQLIVDGRIHPGRIEEVVRKAKSIEVTKEGETVKADDPERLREWLENIKPEDFGKFNKA